MGKRRDRERDSYRDRDRGSDRGGDRDRERGSDDRDRSFKRRSGPQQEDVCYNCGKTGHW